MQRHLVVLSGPAGVGKTSIRNRLLETGRFAFSVSATTRAPRPGEAEGVDYYYLSPAEFAHRVENGDFLEHAWVHTNRYGTLHAEIDRILSEQRIPLLDVDVQGADSIRSQGRPAIYIFIMAPSREELERRLRDRKTEDPSSTQRRLARAHEEILHAEKYDIVVVNDDLERCVGRIQSYVEERLRA